MFHIISICDDRLDVKSGYTEKFFIDVPHGNVSKRVEIHPEVAKYISSLRNDIRCLNNKISLLKSGVII